MFTLKISLVYLSKSVENCGMFTFAKKLLNCKLRILCSDAIFPYELFIQ